MKKILPTATVALALLGAGCGDDDEGASEEPTATPKQAIAEIDEVRAGLDEAVAAYRKGDAAAAEEAASTAYLEHFELVEGPLEEADEELNEELEEKIREELRAEISEDAPVAQVEALVEEIEADLDEAERLLKSEA